jgi:hypothetical protein
LPEVSRLRASLALLVVASCSRRDAPAVVDASPPKASAAVTAVDAAPTTSAFVAVEADAALPPRTPLEIAKEATPPLEANLEDHVVRITTSKGKLAVWSAKDDDASLILAAYESKPGQLLAPAKILRRTSGELAALDAVTVGDAADAGANDDIAVAWTSGLTDGKSQVVAVVFAGTDLVRVTAPTTLGIVAAPIAQQGHVAIKRSPRGGVVVAHQGPNVACMVFDHPDQCLTFEVKAISADGKVTKLGGAKVDGGPSPEYILVDLEERGLLVYASSMRGGRTLESLVVPWTAGGTVPPFDIPVCAGEAAYAPELLRGTRGELAAVCLDGLEETCAKSARDKEKRCAVIAVTGSDGRAITPKAKHVAATRVECSDGKLKVSFSGGDVTLTTRSAHLRDFTKPCGPVR